MEDARQSRWHAGRLIRTVAVLLAPCAVLADEPAVSSSDTPETIEPVDRAADIGFFEAHRPQPSGVRVEFNVPTRGRTSLGIFDRASGRLVRTLLSGDWLPTGPGTVVWDGRTNRGKPAPRGDYEWRALTTPGFTARYVTTIGINPPGGEHPEPRRSWVGDHNGAGIVDVDATGIYVGSPITEGLMMLAKVDASTSRVLWSRPQFYQGGRLTSAATNGRYVFMLHPTGILRRLSADTGEVEAEWPLGTKDDDLRDVDARGANLVVADAKREKLRWLSVKTGEETASARLPKLNCLAVIDGQEKGSVLAAAGSEIHLIQPSRKPCKVATLAGNINAMDYDPMRRELWVVLDGHQVARLDANFHVERVHGDRPRPLGPFDATRFSGIRDIAADLQGGFWVGEPGQPPRRVAHFARDGAVREQWFGGMSFYVDAAFDPEDPTLLYGIAPEGSVNVYRIDYQAETWSLEASYATGRLGDGMFPFAASFRVRRRNGNVYLYHRVVPAVLRLDPELRRAVPVAIAGRVLHQGRTFFQFAGTGRDGYPKPWVAAAESRGYEDLRAAPALYSWADSNGDGEIDPKEFEFYPSAKRGLSFHNPGDFRRDGDYIGSAKANQPHALVRLPVRQWEGPRRDAPRWDWDQLETAGEITADPRGYGSPRGLSVGPDGAVAVAYQAGLMIRDHGHYEGGGWPEAAMRGARVLGFDPDFHPSLCVGRQSKDVAEANSGVLYYPMQTSFGPNQSLIVNDQTKQPAQVWSHDGLYVGGLLDHRANDGRHPDFYRVHGDDNQGATVVTNHDGETYWLMPYQGHNRLYHVSGWQSWHRQSGVLTLSDKQVAEPSTGSGLSARYYRGGELVRETVESPSYFEHKTDVDRSHGVETPYKVVWDGFVVPPLTDRFRFSTLLGKHERVAVWIDGRILHTNGMDRKVDESVDLQLGHRHRIRIEYINPDGPAELKLLWASRVMDPIRLQTTTAPLHPAD